MFEVGGAFVGGEGVESRGDGVPKGLDGAGGGLSEQGFELGEDLLDRVQIRAVGRKIHQRRSHVFDRFADAGHFVAGQVVHDDDVVLLQGGHQGSLHKRRWPLGQRPDRRAILVVAPVSSMNTSLRDQANAGFSAIPRGPLSRLAAFARWHGPFFLSFHPTVSRKRKIAVRPP